MDIKLIQIMEDNLPYLEQNDVIGYYREVIRSSHHDIKPSEITQILLESNVNPLNFTNGVIPYGLFGDYITYDTVEIPKTIFYINRGAFKYCTINNLIVQSPKMIKGIDNCTNYASTIRRVELPNITSYNGEYDTIFPNLEEIYIGPMCNQINSLVMLDNIIYQTPTRKTPGAVPLQIPSAKIDYFREHLKFVKGGI